MRAMLNRHINLPQEKVAAFCKKWQIEELALFGSVLRADFRPDSDVDVLVRFHAEATPSIFDLVRMEDEMKQILGRRVDLIERVGVEQSRNYIRRKAILESAETIYAA